MTSPKPPSEYPRHRAGQPPKWNDDTLWEHYVKDAKEAEEQMNRDVRMILFVVACSAVALLVAWSTA